jgi:hypothetical protein
MMSALFLAHGCTIISRHEILMRYCLLSIKTVKNFSLIWSIYSRTSILCSRNLCFAVFFRSLRFPNIHNGLFTSIFCFQNFHNLQLRGDSFWHKWCPLTELPRFTSLQRLQREQFWQNGVCWEIACIYILSRTTIAICWSAIQLRRACYLLYRKKMAYIVWQSY